MPKECAIDLQKQLRLLVEMSSTLAKEERIVLAVWRASHNVPSRKTCSISNWSKEPFHSIGQGEKGTGKIIVDA
jgi:hypothetical protein